MSNDKQPKNPSVFISYSHGSEAHREWVSMLARRIIKRGIETIYDQQNARAGDMIYAMMDSFIEKANCYLFIVTPEFQQKVANRSPGAGYEYPLILSQIFNEQNPKKCIPVLRTGDFKKTVPSGIQCFNWVDMRYDSLFEKRFSELIEGIIEEQPGRPQRSQNFFSGGFNVGSKKLSGSMAMKAGLVVGSLGFIASAFAQGAPPNPPAEDITHEDTEHDEHHEETAHGRHKDQPDHPVDHDDLHGLHGVENTTFDQAEPEPQVFAEEPAEQPMDETVDTGPGQDGMDDFAQNDEYTHDPGIDLDGAPYWLS